MSLKTISICIHLLHVTVCLHSQSLISASVGVDWTDMEHPNWIEEDLDYLLMKSKSKNPSVIYSLSFEKYLAPKISLGFNTNLTQKSAKAQYLTPDASIHRITFLYFRGSVIAKYYPFPFLFVGVGLNKNYTLRSRFYRSGLTSSISKGNPIKATSKANGVDFLVGAQYKNYFFQLKSSQGFEKERMINYLTILETLNSFSATIGYRINLSKKNK